MWGKEKAKWEFVVRSWEQLFRDRVFEPYEEIFLARDNGPHFRNYNIVKYESEIGYLHNIRHCEFEVILHTMGIAMQIGMLPFVK